MTYMRVIQSASGEIQFRFRLGTLRTFLPFVKFFLGLCRNQFIVLVTLRRPTIKQSVNIGMRRWMRQQIEWRHELMRLGSVPKKIFLTY
jgi:hypothetical protein